MAHRFYVAPSDINGGIAILSVDETTHLIRVLRMRPGDHAYCFDGLGQEYRCRFSSVHSNRAHLEVVEKLDLNLESPLQLTLAQAIVKGEKFDLIVQKTTELGVRTIIPLLTDHSEVLLSDERSTRRIDRWKRISLEALKQCGRSKLVEIEDPVPLPVFLLQAKSAAQIVAFTEKGGLPLKHALSELDFKQPLVAIVGPEGGWSNHERELFDQNNCVSISLGPRILRTETAALAGITLLQYTAGDMSASPDKEVRS